MEFKRWYKKNRFYINDIFSKIMYSIKDQNIKISTKELYNNFVKFVYSSSNINI